MSKYTALNDMSSKYDLGLEGVSSILLFSYSYTLKHLFALLVT